MNRANSLENLIYFFLTSVQVYFLSCATMASPNLNPPPSSPPVESSDSPTSSTDISIAPMDSLILSEPDQSIKNKSTTPSPRHAIKPNRVSLSTGLFSGPHQDSKSKFIYLFGMDYQDPINYSLWNHFGFSVGGGSNPLIYLGQESYLRNYWKYLKSWQYLIQLELDSSQGLGALLSINHYMAGLGLSLMFSDKLDFIISAYPLSSRGVGAEIKFKFLVF